MSEQSQGPGWWKASDGKWYPPEQAPATPPPATQPMSIPGGPPGGPPGGAPGAPAPYVPAAGAAAGGNNNAKVIAVIVALALIGGGVAFALTRGGGGGGGGSVQAFCDAAKKNKNDETINKASNDPKDIDKAVAAVDSINKAAPKEIKSDMQVIDDFIHKLAPGLKSAGNDSDKAFKALEDASNAVGAQKLEAAEKNVDKFSKEKCGVDLGLTGGDSASTDESSSTRSSSSTDFSSFGTDSTFDESSFSSLLSSFSSDFDSSFGSDFFSSLSSQFSTSS